VAGKEKFWAHLNGQLVRGNDAVIPLTDRGVQWGDAVYDSIRTYNGTPFKMLERIERLLRSSYYARIDLALSKEDLLSATEEVLEANLALLEPGDDIMLNYYVSRGSMALTDGLTPRGSFAIFCRGLSFASVARFYVTGAPAMVPTTRRTPPQSVSPKVKASNKMNHFLAEIEAKAFNPDAYAIMADFDGNITEGSGANFLFVSGGRIKVPDTRLVLSGEDMASVLDLAAKMQISADEGTYSTYDVNTADEAFLTTNSFGIMPIVSLNGLPIGTGKVGPVTRSLMRAWVDLVGMDFVAQALKRLPAEEKDGLMRQWLAETA
jgi:branched-chain amino acid aminotransferase